MGQSAEAFVRKYQYKKQGLIQAKIIK